MRIIYLVAGIPTSRMPDTFENLEFGVKYDLPVGLSLTAAYFEVEANKPELIGSTLNSRMVTSEVSGFEIGLRYRRARAL